MEEESGGSSYDSSDGESRSRSPSPFYEPTQLVSSWEEARPCFRKLWITFEIRPSPAILKRIALTESEAERGYGRTEPTQILNDSDYYANDSSKQRGSATDECFEEEEEQEGEPQQQKGEDDGSQTDYDEVYEETQLLEHYNSVQYNKSDLEKLGLIERATDSSGPTHLSQVITREEVDNYEETQLLEDYHPNHFNKSEFAKFGLMQPLLDVTRHGGVSQGNSRGVMSWQSVQVNPDADRRVDEGKPIADLDSEASTGDEVSTVAALRQDHHGMTLGEKPNTSRERAGDFDMDLNVSLEEEMESEFYGATRNSGTQLVTNSDIQLFGAGIYSDTQIVSNNEQQFYEVKSFVDTQLVAHIEKDNSEKNWSCNSQLVRNFEREAHKDTRTIDTEMITNSEADNLHFSDVPVPSFLIRNDPIENPSVSKTPEIIFHSILGSAHAESMRAAALRPLTWQPKLEAEDLSISNSQVPSELGKQTLNLDKGHGSWDLPQQESMEPEWMRKYSDSRDPASRNLLDRRFGLAGSSSHPYVPPLWLRKKNDTSSGNGEERSYANMGGNSYRSLFSGTKAPVNNFYIPSGGYGGSLSKPVIENGGQEKKTTFQQRSNFGTGLCSPTGSLNYLDSPEPGEEVQARALDMVDKLVWLNTNDLSQDSRPKKEKKVLAPGPFRASVLPTDPALSVYEFEDTPQDNPIQKFGSFTMVGETQAGLKKVSEHTRLDTITGKGKDKESKVLLEKEMSRALVPKHSEITESRLPVNVSSGKRISTRSQDAKAKVLIEGAKANSMMHDLDATFERSEERKEGNADMLAKMNEKSLKLSGEGVSVENVDVGTKEDDDNNGCTGDDTIGNDGPEVGAKGKVSVAAHILTRRRTQGRYRRENIVMADAIFLMERSPSLERRQSWGDETEKSPNAARKRKSVNSMHWNQRDTKSRRKEGDGVDDNDGVDEILETSSSGQDLNSGLAVLSAGNGSTLSGRRKRGYGSTDKEWHEACPEAGSLEKGRKRSRIFDASDTRLLGTDDKIDEHPQECVKTRSLRHLPGRSMPHPLERFESGMVKKGLRSVRTRHGMYGVPVFFTSNEESTEHEQKHELQKKSTSSHMSSSSSEGDHDQEAPENDDGCSLENGEETSSRKPAKIYVQDQFTAEDAVAARGRSRRTRSIADVSSPSTPTTVLQSIPFPLVTGRRGRSAVVKFEVTDEAHLECPMPELMSPVPGKGLRMRTVRKRKDPSTLAFATADEPESSRDGSPLLSGDKRHLKRDGRNIRVLFSHGLAEDEVKQQRKILEMLEGIVATKAVDCTHFIAQKFVRTGNMLEAMAAGKFVVTFAWLESCKLANTFVDEMEFILEDERKEEDMCFSMRETLEAAQRKPLLQGIRVMITANTNPKPQAIAAIIKAAGGLVVDMHEGPSLEVDTEDNCVIISNEEDYNVCIPFLEQGAKVYKPELILGGIITHHLDFSKYLLFEGYRSGRRRSGR